MNEKDKEIERLRQALREFRSKGGRARARKLTAEQRRESARKAGKASGEARKKKKKAPVKRTEGKG